MGRSNETYNKKEKEKQRLKKKQDKKERAEERKANTSKGKSLEDMMAYIDEHGNISSTPPDPSKRIQVDTENIQIHIPRQQSSPDDGSRRGVITMFNEQKGFGFIRDSKTQESIFVHISGVLTPVKENDQVLFETAQGQKGLCAVKVRKA